MTPEPVFRPSEAESIIREALAPDGKVPQEADYDARQRLYEAMAALDSLVEELNRAEKREAWWNDWENTLNIRLREAEELRDKYMRKAVDQAAQVLDTRRELEEANRRIAELTARSGEGERP